MRQETAALAAELQRKYQAVRSLEVRCWGLQNEPGQTPSTEVSSSRCLSVRRGHECVSVCTWKSRSEELRQVHCRYIEWCPPAVGMQ